MSFCKQCIFWKFSYETRDRKMGSCSNHIVIESVAMDTNLIASEEGVLHTDQYFGCVNFRKKALTVTKGFNLEDIALLNKVSQDPLFKICDNCNSINEVGDTFCINCKAVF